MPSRDISVATAESLANNIKYLRDADTPTVSPEAFRGPYRTPEPRAQLIWLAVDLDGTLAEPVWTAANPTSQIGDPIARNVAKLRHAVGLGYKIVIHTARGWTDYENIEGWLNHYDIPFDKIVCGKILAALYIDDRGRHSEDESWLPAPKEH